ncbi:hypothetical protein L4X63_11270 [Geomonas sp. Red32]|uniref:hypothetical protein n=1 Tax=Geomonas sp. Red32 TaxID=2912856 RepID=UPI00202D09C4|nr:hypothetical protein [Geomonas sp. Red32]MCM0082172.1 hypothetical protein [Geomonas sp. Red32]
MKHSELVQRVGFIREGGKLIFKLDFSGLTLEDIKEVIAYGKPMISRMQKGTLLSLTDVSDTEFDDQAKEVFKELLEYNKPFVQAGAVVGVNGWRKLVYMVSLKMSGRNNLRLFDNSTDAKDWLLGYSADPVPAATSAAMR